MSTRSRALAHAEGAAGPEICAHCFQLVRPRRVCVLCTQRSANHLTCVASALGLGADGVDGPFDKMVPRLMCGDHPLAGVFDRRQMCKPCSLMWARTQIVRVAQQPVCGACPSLCALHPITVLPCLLHPQRFRLVNMSPRAKRVRSSYCRNSWRKQWRF